MLKIYLWGDSLIHLPGPHLATLTFERGDEDIDKETSYNLEIGLGRNNKHSSWQVNTFYNHISDYIYLSLLDENNDGIADRVDEEGMFELDGELLLGEYANEDAEFYGVEAEATMRAYESESVTLDARVFGDYVRAKFDDSSVGNIPRITPSRIGVGIDTTYKQWNANVDMTQMFDQTKSAQLETDTDGFLMFNARLSRDVYIGDTDVSLFLKAENLFDEDARVHTSFQKDRVTLPGRNMVAGLSFTY